MSKKSKTQPKAATQPTNGHYKLSDIWATREAYQTLLVQKGLQARVAIQIALLTRQLEPNLKLISEIQNKLVEKYGTKNDKGQFAVEIDSPEGQKLIAEFNEALQEEVDLTVKKVVLPGSIEIDAKTLLLLEPFVTVEG